MLKCETRYVFIVWLTAENLFESTRNQNMTLFGTTNKQIWRYDVSILGRPHKWQVILQLYKDDRMIKNIICYKMMMFYEIFLENLQKHMKTMIQP